jgi:hypothetical protein
LLDVGPTRIEDTFRIKLVHLLTLYKSALEPEALVCQVLSAPVANLPLFLGKKTPVFFLPEAHYFIATRIFSETVDVTAGTAGLVAHQSLLVGHLFSGLYLRVMHLLLCTNQLMICSLLHFEGGLVDDA